MRRSRGRLGNRTPRVVHEMPFLITSMLDMFTIILLFLLNFLDPASDETRVELPSVQTPTAASPGVVLTVARDQVLVDGEQVLSLADGRLPAGGEAALAPVRERLAAAGARARQGSEGAQQSASNATLSVQADRAVSYRVVAGLLSAAREAGFSQYHFIVIAEPG